MGTLHYIYEWTEINNLTAPQWLFFFSSFSPSDSQGARLDFLPTKSLGHGASNHYMDRQANICTNQPTRLGMQGTREHSLFQNGDDFKHQPPGRLFLGYDKDYKYHSERLDIHIVTALPGKSSE